MAYHYLLHQHSIGTQR